MKQPAKPELDACRRCGLWANATQGVPGAGPSRAAIMLVGEQPGDQEDLAGLPFVGPAGQLLDRALAEAGLARADVYITNAVKHFKWELRGKRRMHKTPAQREVEACRHWLEQELARINPRVVVALGSTALKSILQDPGATLRDAMGTAIEHADRIVIATYHPSFALRAVGHDERARVFAEIVKALRLANGARR